MSLIAELKRRNVFRVGVAYAIVSWLLIQVVETIFPAFGLDDAAFRMLVIALAIGLVPVVILAWAFELTREGLKPERDMMTVGSQRRDDSAELPPTTDQQSFFAVLRQPRFAVPISLASVMALGTIGVLAIKLSGSQKTRQETIPKIVQLIEQDDYVRAYALAEAAEQYLPNDPVLTDLWPRISVQMSIVLEPSGTDVFYKLYNTPDDDWISLGQTPIESLRLPRTVLRWRFEKEGFEPAERMGESFSGTYRVSLAQGSLPSNMVRVPTSTIYFLLTGLNPPEIEVPQFLVDRHEVPNRQYLEFVESGGYDNKDYWKHLTFVLDDEDVSWETAMARFRDSTGRHAPSTWKGGTFPEGEEDYPVTGVSWFEAAAYAKFRGKELPTIYHWSSLAIFPSWDEIELEPPGQDVGYGMFRSEMISRSNFSGSGTVAVGSNDSVAPYGTYDVAGNVREWCWNATKNLRSSERYILGGAWSDPSYLYTYGIAESPWDRSETNGFRLAQYADQSDLLTVFRQPVELPAQEQIQPISDEIFEVYRDLYDYDRTALNAIIESVDKQSTHWIHEIVSFDAPYGNERVITHIFLPKNIEPPYQVVAYYPTSSAIYTSTSDDLELPWLDFIIKSGRALVYPVLIGTYERNIGLDTTWPKDTRTYSDYVIKWIQDFRRTIDYLESRDDMDLARLAYYGYSWGGWNGPIVLALDDRFKTGVFVSGGIPPSLARPEASSASFAARVNAPVLMISGRHDVLRPVATYQTPMFQSLGTSDDRKRHAILDGGHSPPRNQVIRETLDWLDQYLGLVQ
jgi:formylglycine-generating enzyme required for sulfatase activity/pimeloyl-ACP methyl ester carboxylesterase